MNALKRYLEQSGELRKRSVHLLYLVFLVLIFSFIPTHEQLRDQISAEEFLEVSNEKLFLSTQSNVLFLHLIQDDQALYSDVKFRSLEAERAANASLDNIEQLLKNAVERIDKPASKQLFSSIERSKQALDELSSYQISNELESLMGNKDFVEPSPGEYFDKYEYYFRGKDPEETSRALVKIQAGIKQGLSLCLQQILENAVESPRSSAILKKIKLANEHKWSNILKATSLTEFFESLESANTQHNRTVKRGGSFEIKAMQTDRVHIGQLLSFQINFQDSKADKLLVKIGKEDPQYYSVPKGERFYYVARESGKLHIEFTYEDESHREIINVEELDHSKSLGPELISLGQGSFYQLHKSIQQLNLPLQYECEFGSVEQTVRGYRIVPKKLGLSSLKIYAQTSYGPLLVEERTFNVIPPLLPKLSLSQNGTAVRAADIQAIDRLYWEDMELTGLEYQLVTFRLSVFNPLGGSNKRSSLNRGMELNQASKELLASSKRGDIVLIDQIRLKANGSLYEADAQSFSLR